MTTTSGVKTDALGDIRRRLKHERGRLMRTVTRTEEELTTLEAHELGDLADRAATDLERTILSRLEEQERHELDEIDEALERLEAGMFGLCERCGQAIPILRLRAMPTARYCLPCRIRVTP